VFGRRSFDLPISQSLRVPGFELGGPLRDFETVEVFSKIIFDDPAI
jgi:hypothetical protein